MTFEAATTGHPGEPRADERRPNHPSFPPIPPAGSESLPRSGRLPRVRPGPVTTMKNLLELGVRLVPAFLMAILAAPAGAAPQ